MISDKEPGEASEPGDENRAAFDPEAGYRDFITNVEAGEARLSDPPSMTALDHAEIARLAKLSPIEYDRERKQSADLMGIRAETLDAEVRRQRSANGADDAQKQGRALQLPEPAPWREKVDGTALLDELAGVFSRHVTLPDGAADALALWTLHTHCFDVFPITPRLAITSPTMGCGKSTLLGVLAALVARPLQAANVTAAAIFRTVEAAKPVLLIDEADSFLTNSDELRGILNSGHRSDGFAIRLVGDDNEPRQFATFAPAAIAAIGKLPPTLMNRSVVIHMRRRKPDEAIEELIHGKPKGSDKAARQCARWANDHRVTLANATPTVPGFLHNRSADNWRPLFAIADAAGENWPEWARTAARLLTDATVDDDDTAIWLLTDIKALFEAAGTDRLTSEAICSGLAAMEHRPWPEYRHGKPITKKQLAGRLAPFGIAPVTIRPADGKTAKGYHLADFADVFSRYIPSDPSQRHDADGIEVSSDSRSVTKDPMLRIDNARKPNNDAGCDGVTDRKGVSAEETGLWTG